MALTVYGQSGWKHQSVAASSFDTWIKYYRPDAGSASHGVSYYQGGAMLAFALDLHVTGESSEPVAKYLQDRYFCILPSLPLRPLSRV